MEDLDPIGEQLSVFLKSDKIIAYTNAKYDLMVSVDVDWFEIKCKNDGNTILYHNEAWSFPQKYLSKDIYQDFLNETFGMEIKIRDKFLNSLVKYPYYKDFDIDQDNSAVLNLHRIDEAFLESFYCFDYEGSKNIPLIKSNCYDIGTLEVLVSNTSTKGIKLVLSPDKNNVETLLNYKIAMPLSSKKTIIIGAGVRKLFGSKLQELYMEIDHDKLKKILEG